MPCSTAASRSTGLSRCFPHCARLYVCRLLLESPVGVCELLATARAAASIGAIGTLGGAATTSVPGALLLAAVPSTDGDSDKASIEEVLTAQPYCRMPPRQGLLGVRDRGVATLPRGVATPPGSSPWRRRGFAVSTRKPEGGLVSVPALPPRHNAPTLFRLCLRLSYMRM